MAMEGRCPKCKTQMEDGALIDRSYGRTDISSWVKGMPEMGWFGVKLRGAKLYVAMTYRCPVCGYLKSYAKEP